MKCPFCGYTESRVIDSRPAEEGATIRRRRECLACQKRFTTYEIIERLPLVVIKRDGSRQTFDMDRLKDVDEVAYVRFASVYRSFKDINTFMEELTKLLKQKEN